MSFLSHHGSYPMRPANKEPQWAVYDDIFAQYIDTEHFDLEGCNTTASSLDGASKNTASNIEDLTDSTSSSSSDAKKIADDEFWANTLRALEESAASVGGTEQRGRQTSRDTKQQPHSDFLSLGGYPSPHLGSSPTSPSEAARRRKGSRCRAGYPSRTPEKPTGINKAYRSGSKSPKMMTPSRYRAGFRDTWAERMRNVPRALTMDLPVRSMPLSPPSSTKIKQEFCSPRDIDAIPYQPFAHYEEQVSPFSSAFPQPVPVDTHTPKSSPLTTPGVERGAGFGDFGYEAIRNPDVFYESEIQQRTSWNSFDLEDDYEPSPMISPWIAGEMSEQRHRVAPEATMYQPLSNPHTVQDLGASGLMISYDPTLAPAQDADELGIFNTATATVPDAPYYVTAEAHSPARQSCSPSPPPRHRRTSSKGQTRKISSPRRASGGGFVNYTASDKAKLLTGVAPSGSSKTKARREKEAAEKRRQFSQAAVKAVAEAGGNITALRDVLI